MMIEISGAFITKVDKFNKIVLISGPSLMLG